MLKVVNQEQNRWGLRCELCEEEPVEVCDVLDTDADIEHCLCPTCAGIVADSKYLSTPEALAFVCSDKIDGILYNRRLPNFSKEEVRNELVIQIMTGEVGIRRIAPYKSVKLACLNITRNEIKRRKKFSFQPLTPAGEGVIRQDVRIVGGFAEVESCNIRVDIERFRTKLLDNEEKIVFDYMLQEKTWKEMQEVLGKRPDYVVRKVREKGISYFKDYLNK